MKLNAMMIYEEICGKKEVSLLGKFKEECTLRFAAFFDGHEEGMTKGGVYLVDNGHLPRKVPQETDILWVTWGGEPPVAIAKCPVLYFHEETDPLKIFNLVQAVFVKFALWEEKMDDILREKNNISKMIEVSEPLFEHPLCVVDTSLNYLGYSSSFMSKGREVFFPEGDRLLDRHKMEGDGVMGPALFYDGEQDKILQL